MTSLLDYDPNVDGIIEHFGVKGMKWGVRRERKRGERIRKAYTDNDSLGRSKEATKAKVAQLKVDKAEAMKNYEEHLAAHDAKTAKRIKGMEADKKSWDDTVKKDIADVKAGKGSRFIKNRAEWVREATKEGEMISNDYDRAIAKYKAKRQKEANQIKTEMVEQGKEWDAAVATVRRQNTGESISTGKASVNYFFTGNPDGRITRSTVAAYGVSAALIAAMAYDMYRG